jgi:hypothetical protein
LAVSIHKMLSQLKQTDKNGEVAAQPLPGK